MAMLRIHFDRTVGVGILVNTNQADLFLVQSREI